MAPILRRAIRVPRASASKLRTPGYFAELLRRPVAAPIAKKSPKKRRAVPRAVLVAAVPASNPKAYTKVANQLSHKWQFSHGGWHDMDAAASHKLEAAYGAKKSKAIVHSGEWSYSIDLAHLLQTNRDHYAHTSRSIRRVLC